MPKENLFAIDTGGTFTDAIWYSDRRLHVEKIFSTPDDPGRAVREVVKKNTGQNAARVRLGTTVGTNLILERKGARVAFVTTAGFEDLIFIGRQNRQNLYDWHAKSEPQIVQANLCFGVPERTTAAGEILQAPSDSELAELAKKIAASGADAIAISLLFSFANPANEAKVAQALSHLNLPISRSAIILPEFREFERSSTTVLNSYCIPKVGSYLQTLDQAFGQGRLEVMMSSGGLASAPFLSEQPVRTALSGPAGGVMGAYFVASQAGFDKIITVDIGGTSTDVALFDVREGAPKTTHESVLAHLPIGVPMLEIHTVGAGGGSIAYFDNAGLLHVGPRSAGANPGPICYGRGTEPTVSDANVILGRLSPKHFLGGEFALDSERTQHFMNQARQSMASVEAFAAGIVDLAEANICGALRLISVQRGHDPREFTLLAFGGAGPLHACALAKALKIPRVLVPNMPGALSALGILLSPRVRDYSKTVMLPAAANLEPHFAELEQLAAVDQKGVASRTLDLRYAGQGYELNVAAGEAALEQFHAAHRRRYGYADATRPVEVVNVRLRMTVPGEPIEFPKSRLVAGDGSQAITHHAKVVFGADTLSVPFYQREMLQAGNEFSGPAIVLEYSATTVVPPGSQIKVDQYKNLIIEVQ